MFRKLLIANRGEIARRIARAVRGRGIATVAVYSDADRDAPHVREADEAVRIGPPPPRESYLSIPALLEAARRTGADAIHPGYGFLAENAAFARAVAEAGLAFVGPPAETMARMKDKAEARRLVAAAGVPTVPGTAGTVGTVEEAREAAARIGFPVLVKAAGGGGGIGMAAARDDAELVKAFRAATDRARSAFGREAVYLERYLPAPRHVEVQILADRHGDVVHLFERECSVQRRHQKVIEESPSPLLGAGREALLLRLWDAAVRAARVFGYENAGTVEFLVQGDRFYFIEMNARLQVEHPITEAVTGVDLVGAQLRLATGERLDVDPLAVGRRGHAVELRIYAEDPVRMLPAPGRIEVWEEPSGEGLRVDAGYEAGMEVTPFYDPLLAKLIVHGENREAAIDRALDALGRFRIEGEKLKTNLPLLRRVLGSEEFRRGETDTGLLDRLLSRP
jgi:acetyl-CoA carboxylase biotin carboxylase subunit